MNSWKDVRQNLTPITEEAPLLISKSHIEGPNCQIGLVTPHNFFTKALKNLSWGSLCSEVSPKLSNKAGDSISMHVNPKLQMSLANL
jgi:hypothetical protein